MSSSITAATTIIAEDADEFGPLRDSWVASLRDGADLPVNSPVLAWRK